MKRILCPNFQWARFLKKVFSFSLKLLVNGVALAIDSTGIQFRMLNKSKGPAVWGPRAQADKEDYVKYFINVISKQKNLDLRQETVTDIVIVRKQAAGVRCISGNRYRSCR